MQVLSRTCRWGKKTKSQAEEEEEAAADDESI
jgi:hypothetical protein